MKFSQFIDLHMKNTMFNLMVTFDGCRAVFVCEIFVVVVENWLIFFRRAGGPF